jgi:hypothetical protein
VITAVSHTLMLFGPASVTRGRSGLLGIRTAALRPAGETKAPEGSDIGTAIATTSPGRMVAPEPSTTVRTSGEDHPHADAEPNRSGASSSSEHESGGALVARSKAISMLPNELDSRADRSLGARWKDISADELKPGSPALLIVRKPAVDGPAAMSAAPKGRTMVTVAWMHAPPAAVDALQALIGTSSAPGAWQSEPEPPLCAPVELPARRA